VTARNRHTLIAGALVALLVAGVVSYFASRNPDGLEATQVRLGIAASPDGGVAPPPSPFKDYGLRWLPAGFASNAVAGLAGTVLVLAILLGLGALLKRSRQTEATEATRSTLTLRSPLPQGEGEQRQSSRP